MKTETRDYRAGGPSDLGAFTEPKRVIFGLSTLHTGQCSQRHVQGTVTRTWLFRRGRRKLRPDPRFRASFVALP